MSEANRDAGETPVAITDEQMSAVDVALRAFGHVVAKCDPATFALYWPTLVRATRPPAPEVPPSAPEPQGAAEAPGASNARDAINEARAEYRALADEHVGLRRMARAFFYEVGIPSNPGWAPTDFAWAFAEAKRRYDLRAAGATPASGASQAVACPKNDALLRTDPAGVAGTAKARTEATRTAVQEWRGRWQAFFDGVGWDTAFFELESSLAAALSAEAPQEAPSNGVAETGEEKPR